VWIPITGLKLPAIAEGDISAYAGTQRIYPLFLAAGAPKLPGVSDPHLMQIDDHAEMFSTT
jgi:hypothetical protein